MTATRLVALVAGASPGISVLRRIVPTRYPVLVANAGDDRMLPTRASFDLAHRLPNASLRICPDAGPGGVFPHQEQFVPHVLELLR